MLNAVVNRLERFLATDAGSRFLAEAEADSAAKEAAIQVRRDHVATISEFRRQRQEGIPGFDRREQEAEEVVQRLKAELKAAERRMHEARTEGWNERSRIAESIRRAELALTQTADPRIAVADEEVSDRLRTWHYDSGRLLRWESRKVPVRPHTSDPDFKVMTREGYHYLLERHGTNAPAVHAMRERMEAAREALHRLALVAEPAEEEILRALAEARASIEASKESPPIVFTEPRAPRFDGDGIRVP